MLVWLVGLTLVSIVTFYGDNFKIDVLGFTVSPFDFLILIFFFFFFLTKAIQKNQGTRSGSVFIQGKIIKGVLFAGILYLIGFPILNNTDYPLPDIIRDWRVVLYLILTPWVVKEAFSSKKDFELFRTFLLISGIAVSISFIILVFESYSMAIDPLRVSNLGFWVVPFSLVSLMMFNKESEPPFKKILYWVTIVILLSAVVLSLNRGQYLQLVCSLILLGFLGQMERRKITSVFIVLIALSLIVIALANFTAYGYHIKTRLQTVSRIATDVSIASRIEELNMQMAAFWESPAFGKGPGFRSLTTSPNVWVWEESLFAHNSFAYYLMKFGIIGSVLILLNPVLILVAILSLKVRGEFLIKHKRLFLITYLAYLCFDFFSAAWSFAPKSLFSGILLGYGLSMCKFNDNRYIQGSKTLDGNRRVRYGR